MKKGYGYPLLNLVIAFFISLSAGATYSSSGISIQVQFQNNFNTLPKGAKAVIPGLYLQRAQTKQLLLFDEVVHKGIAKPRKIYLPPDTQSIKPFLIFSEDHGVNRYWYCNEQQKVNKIKEGMQLNVRVKALPEASMPAKNQQQFIACSYQVVPMPTHSIKRKT